MATETIDLVPESIEGEPIHTNGDAEFWGPPVFKARMWLEHRAKVIVLRVEARWEEPKPDFTTFRFNSRMVLFDIRRRKGPDWYFVNFKDQYDLDLGDGRTIPGLDRGLQELYRSNDGLINAVYAEGDSRGGLFGGADHPKLRVTFNRVYFDVSNE